MRIIRNLKDGVPMKHLLFSSAALTALITATNASAQTADPIDEIIVTANKIERSVQDTKESIAVITAANIEEKALLNLVDLFNDTANVYQQFNGEGFGIRGITTGGTSGGDGEVLSYYIDGVAYTGFARRFGPINLWDVEQVEVLRGPQTTNVGRNALAGAVSVVTKSPVLNDYEGAVRISAGNYETYTAEGVVNVPVGETAALRFAGEYHETNGFITNVTRDENDFDARENLTLRGKFLWQPSDDLSVILTGQYAETSRGNDLFIAGFVTDIEDRQQFANLDDFEDYEAVTTTLDVTYDINEQWQLKSITSFIDGDYNRFDDDDLSAAGGNAFRGRQAEDRNWAEELRLTYDGDKIDGVIGGYYTDVDLLNVTTGLSAILPADVGVPNVLLPFYPSEILIDVFSSADIDTQNIAIFGELDYYLSNNLRINIGARYETEDQERVTRVANTTNATTPLPDPATAGAQATALFGPVVGAQVQGGVTQVNAILAAQLTPTQEVTDTSYSAFLPQIGLTYDLSDATSISAFAKQGYRAGGASLSLTGGLSEFDAETLTNYEVAFRSSFWDGRATFNANAYYGDWKDQQVSFSQNGNIFDIITVNSGKSEIMGFETAFNVQDNKGLSAYANFGYAHTEFKVFNTTSGDLSGNEFAFSPNVTWSVGATKAFDNGLFIGANLNAQGDAYADVQNTSKVDSFELVNLQGGYQTDNYTISFYTKNITDEVYKTSSGIRGVQEIIKLGAPRTYGVQLMANF